MNYCSFAVFSAFHSLKQIICFTVETPSARKYPVKGVGSCSELHDLEGSVPDIGKKVHLQLHASKVDNCGRDPPQNCPSGWEETGGHCFKIVTANPVGNDEASRRCNEFGSELLQVTSESVHTHIAAKLKQRNRYEEIPLIYHFGTYRNRFIDSHYHRNGGRFQYFRYADREMTPIIGQANVERTCIAYKRHDPGRASSFGWMYADCETKGGFICEFNPDFLGYHKRDNIIGEILYEVTHDEMTLTACLAICVGHKETTHVATLLKTKCTCFKEGAKYKKPHFKLVNRMSKQILIGANPGGPVSMDNDVSDPKATWTFNGPSIESVGVPGQSLEINEADGKLYLKESIDSPNQHIVMTSKNELINQYYDFYVNQASDQVTVAKQKLGAFKWDLKHIGSTESEEVFEPMSSPPHQGSYPFMCKSPILYRGIHQTVGCLGFEDEELVIAFHVGPGSIYRKQLDFPTCYDLKVHGVDMDGYFKINNESTYCKDYWSK